MHPSLIQINARLLHYQFANRESSFTMLDIPDSYWQKWKDDGFEWIWLMGFWENTESSVGEYAFDAGLKKAYSAAIPDWQDTDVTGSPYAIDRYEPWPRLGTLENLKTLHARLNSMGLKLMLDFVPNHFNAHSSYIEAHPSIFVQGTSNDLKLDSDTYYLRNGQIFAHGKDPYFPAWTDTVQVDYSRSETRSFMIERILDVAACCDGIRCDMAMLLLNDVFERTWNRAMPESEFWQEAINKVKSKHPTFCFMAETYWDLEWQLQQLGFDYTYDKRLLDRLINGDEWPIYNHLKADYGYQTKSVRFLENHDEDRAMAVFGPIGSQAAAMIAYTTPGMRFFFDGQQYGYQKHLPVQMGRPATEHTVYECWPEIAEDERIASNSTYFFYEKLWALLRMPLLRKGNFKLHSFNQSVFEWSWTHENESCHLLINWSNRTITKGCPLTGTEHFSGKPMAQNEPLQLFAKQYAAIVAINS